MGQINLFKIDSQKHEEFFSELGLKYGCVGEKVLNREMIGVPNTKIDLSLFLVVPENEENVEWSWLLQYFGHKDETSRSNPRGVLVIKFEEDVYACTYGFSYFVVDKFCDSDFAFNFARRVEYREIKTTSLISPGSKRNKAINTYIDYDELEFDSGESFTKLKVNLNLEEGFELFKEGIEIGRSIKFHTSEDSIGTILDILNYVENIIRSKNEIYKIPIFSKVRDKEFKKVLNNNLAKSLEDGLLKISLSELDIIGVVEVFKSPDSFYKIKFNRKNEQLSHLSSEVITGFIEECGLNLYEGLEKVKIVSYQNETETRTDLLYNLIDHIDEENNCVLTKGEWYRFNGDYLDYLNDSLREIDIVYEERFDYSSKLHEEFVKKKINAEIIKKEQAGLRKEEIEGKLQRKYYREYAFNLRMNEDFGFTDYDRFKEHFELHQYEKMDLHKDDTAYTVKIGGSSSVLSYAVDQSLEIVKLYKKGELKNFPETKKFCIWLILDRRTKLGEINGKPDINELKMLILKNKLDVWKKEVRLLGYNPVLRLNYFDLNS